MGGDLAHVAIAVQGAKAGTPDSLALAVAAKGKLYLSIPGEINTAFLLSVLYKFSF